MIALSNTAIAQRIDIEHFAGDSFARYVALETPQGEAFDASGYVFSFIVYNHTAKLWRFLNLVATLTSESAYLTLEKAAGVILQEGLFRYELRAVKGSKNYTLLTGKFRVTSDETSEFYSDDEAEIDSPLLKLKMTMLLVEPTGDTIEPGLGIGYLVIGSTFQIA